MLFDYTLVLYHVFYTPVLVAVFGLASPAFFSGRRLALGIVYAWALGVILPHLAATTKTPSATLVAMPALLLLLAHLISEAWAGNRRALALWAGITLVCLIAPGRLDAHGHGYPDPPVFAGVMRQSMWVVYHVAAAFGIASLLYVWLRGRRGPGTLRIARAVACIGTIVMACQCLGVSLRAVAREPARPAFCAMAAFVRAELPREAVLLFDGPNSGEHNAVMMAADRTCYSLCDRRIDVVALRVIEHGGIPYLVSSAPQPRPALYRNAREGRAIYAWTPPRSTVAGTLRVPSLFSVTARGACLLRSRHAPHGVALPGYGTRSVPTTKDRGQTL